MNMFNKVKNHTKILKILNIPKLNVSRVLLYLAMELLFLNLQTFFLLVYIQDEKLDHTVFTIYQYSLLEMVFSNEKVATSYP